MSTPYEPALRTDAWLSVQDFVVSAVEDAAPKVRYSPKDLMLTCSRLAVWAHRSAGLPLERTDVFSREVIAEFIAIGCPTFNEAARGNMRSQLLRISETLLDISDVPRRLAPMASSDPVEPYTVKEQISLRSWANGQSTPARRANARVLVGACLGAGLSASEVGSLRVRDIEVDEVGVVLAITGERARRVPVLEEWAAYLAGRVTQLSQESFAFRENHTAFYPNLVSNFVARSSRVGVRPQTQRMRATWIVRHLAEGTPVVLLMGAGGVDSLEALTRYVRFVPSVEWDAARRMLTLLGPEPISDW
jgi:hypothetical protein